MAGISYLKNIKFRDDRDAVGWKIATLNWQAHREANPNQPLPVNFQSYSVPAWHRTLQTGWHD